MVVVVVVVVVAAYLSIYLSVCLSVGLSVYLSICLSICKLENAAILRHFRNFWTWQHPKRNKSARLPQFLNLTTSKTKQFCETSFKNGKLSAELTASYHCENFPLHLSKVPRLPRKIDARSYELLHLSRKITLANLQIWCSKMQPLSGNQRPDLLTSLMNMSLVLRLPREMRLCRSSSNVPRLPSFLDMLQNLTFCSLFDFEMCFAPHRRALFRHLNFQKCWGALYIFTWTCALRHNGVHFFDIATWKVLRTWSAFNFFSCKCASRHNGVQFLISHLASWLRTRRFSEPTFRASRAHKSLEKHSVSRLSYLFAHLDLPPSETFSFWSFFFFSSLLWLFPSLLFICPYCRKFDF